LSLRPPLVFLLVCLARSAAAEPALFGSAELAAGGGHDDNMFLQVSPDTLTREPPLSGWFGHLGPRLGAGLSAAGLRLDLTYSLDYRGSAAAGHLALQQGELSLALPHFGRLRSTLIATVSRFDASRFSADRFVSAGGGLDLRFEITESVRISAAYRFERRSFPGRSDESDNVHLGELRFGYRPTSSVDLGIGTSILDVAPTAGAATEGGALQMVRVGPDTQLVWHWLTLALSAWGGSIEVASLGRDVQVGGAAIALFRLAKNLDLSVALDLTAAPWASDARAEDYTRRYMGLGLLVHETGRVPLGAGEKDDLRPKVEPGRVRLRVHAPAAMAVEVVGSWDDWAAPGRTLSLTKRPGLWEAWVDVPPGTHRYRFMIDGRATRPPDAPRYQRDDFGGEDAVIDVPGAAP
jgi:hypothetical protein